MMNDRIEILAATSTADVAGQPIKTWAQVANPWADVRFQTGAEVIRAGAETSVVKVSIRIHATAVDETMRVVHKGKTYEVKSALPDSKDTRFMFLVCESAK